MLIDDLIELAEKWDKRAKLLKRNLLKLAINDCSNDLISIIAKYHLQDIEKLKEKISG